MENFCGHENVRGVRKLKMMTFEWWWSWRGVEQRYLLIKCLSIPTLLFWLSRKCVYHQQPLAQTFSHSRIAEGKKKNWDIFIYIFTKCKRTQSFFYISPSPLRTLFVDDGNAMPDTCLIIMIDFYLIFPRKTKNFPTQCIFTHIHVHILVARDGHFREK